MSKRRNDFISAQDALHEMIKENRLQHGIDNVAVKEAWTEVMGNGVSSYTDSIELKKDTLIIKLTSSTLREELSYGREKIILMMNEYLGKAVIRAVKLQ